MNTTLVRFYNIQYDTDGDMEQHNLLPSEVLVLIPETKYEPSDGIDSYIQEYGADEISDQTGWCVFSFSYDIV